MFTDRRKCVLSLRCNFLTTFSPSCTHACTPKHLSMPVDCCRVLVVTATYFCVSWCALIYNIYIFKYVKINAVSIQFDSAARLFLFTYKFDFYQPVCLQKAFV